MISARILGATPGIISLLRGRTTRLMSGCFIRVDDQPEHDADDEDDGAEWCAFEPWLHVTTCPLKRSSLLGISVITRTTTTTGSRIMILSYSGQSQF